MDKNSESEIESNFSSDNWEINQSLTSESEVEKVIDVVKWLKCSVEGCNDTFRKQKKLQHHILCHTGEKPYVCDVEGCKKAYRRNQHLKRHKDLAHSEVQKVYLNCDKCDKRFTDKYNMKRHVFRAHNPDRKFAHQCETCKKGFSKKYMLLKHSYEHTGLLPFQCEICGKRFISIGNCKRHKRTHTQYPCKCGEVFERWSILLSHKKVCEKLNKHKCDICNAELISLKSLSAHKKIHDEENKQVFICNYEGCSRFYLYKKNLTYHIKYYHEKAEKPKFYCTFFNCEKSFSQMQKLNDHLMRHKVGQLVKELKKPRKPRKDKGITRTEYALKFSGLKRATDNSSNVVIVDCTRHNENSENNGSGDNQKKCSDVAVLNLISNPIETEKAGDSLSVQEQLISDKRNFKEKSDNNQSNKFNCGSEIKIKGILTKKIKFRRNDDGHGSDSSVSCA